MSFNVIAELVRDANPQRSQHNVKRRALKLLEELGEVSEAWLNVTSSQNRKNKSWDDVREELADTLIVALDVWWTVIDGEETAPSMTPVAEASLEFIDHCFLITFYLSHYVSNLDKTPNSSRLAIGRVVSLTFALAQNMQNIQQDTLIIDVKRKLDKWQMVRSPQAIPDDGSD